MKKQLLASALLFSVAFVTGQAFSQPKEKQKLPMQTRIEMLEGMAKAHQAAADCLKAGKPEEQCREEMQKSCPMAEGNGDCPVMEGGMNMMMGGGVRGRIARGKGMMKGPREARDKEGSSKQTPATGDTGASEKKQ